MKKSRVYLTFLLCLLFACSGCITMHTTLKTATHVEREDPDHLVTANNWSSFSYDLPCAPTKLQKHVGFWQFMGAFFTLGLYRTESFRVWCDSPAQVSGIIEPDSSRALSGPVSPGNYKEKYHLEHGRADSFLIPGY